jgi:hypothetical protein
MMLFEDSDLADQMGVCGRSYVEQQYEWDNVFKNVESAIEIAKVELKKRPVTLGRG